MAQAATVTGTGGNLSDAQIASVARQGGFPESEIPLAVAIAKKESGGNPRAHNPKPPDNSYGLWQINMIGAMGPNRRKAFGITNNDALFDPVVNAKAAYRIRQEQGWKAWSTYEPGMAVGSIGAATDGSGATAGIGEIVVGPVTSGLAEALVGKKIAEFNESTRKVAVTYAVLAVALVLLILGVVIINRQSVGKLAGALPVGRVAKIAKVLK